MGGAGPYTLARVSRSRNFEDIDFISNSRNRRLIKSVHFGTLLKMLAAVASASKKCGLSVRRQFS